MTSLLAALVPRGTIVVEVDMDDPIPDLLPSERDHVHGAVPSRVSEFATGRRCARDAMVLLGRERGAVPAGPHREPVWPDGLVGSITHCTGYRGAALAVASHDIAGPGVDAEPNAPLPPGALELVASEDERRGPCAAGAALTGESDVRAPEVGREVRGPSKATRAS